MEPGIEAQLTFLRRQLPVPLESLSDATARQLTSALKAIEVRIMELSDDTSGSADLVGLLR